MNETSLLNNIFKLRAKKIDKYATEAEAIQMRVLTELVQKAAGTEWGKEHSYSTIRSYEDFARNVPVQDYESLKGYIDRMRHGESDVLWRGNRGDFWYYDKAPEAVKLMVNRIDMSALADLYKVTKDRRI